MRTTIACNLAFKCIFSITLAVASYSAVAIDVNVYSERQQVFLDPIVKSFEKISGHNVSVLYLDKGALPRLKSEGEHSLADVIIVADIGKLAQLSEGDVVQPINSKKIDEAVPGEFRDSHGLWLGLTRRLRVLFVPKGSNVEISSFEELKNPEWGSKLCMRSGFHPYNVALVAAHHAHHGERKTRRWLKGLHNNMARKPQGNDRAQIKAVANGDCGAAIANLYYYEKMLESDNDEEREAAAKVDWKALTLDGRGAHSNISGVAMAKHSPNPEAALELIEYMVSPEAQEIYAMANKELPISHRTRVGKRLRRAHGVKVDSLRMEEIARHRARASELLDEEDFDGARPPRLARSRKHNRDEHHRDGHHSEEHHRDGHHREEHHRDGHHSEEHHRDGHHSEEHHRDGHHSEEHHSDEDDYHSDEDD